MGQKETEWTWVPGADASGFGIEHLPYGVIRARGGAPRPAVRIGDSALVLEPLAASALLESVAESDPEGLRRALAEPTLNRLLELGRPTWSRLRARLTELLGAGNGELTDAGIADDALVPLDEAEEVVPIEVGDYVDFYSSIEHASNVGRLFRPEDEPLFPNWRHHPVGYHGRAAGVVVSGTPIRRPVGQTAPDRPDGRPPFGPEPRLDFELELGFVTGPGPEGGEPITTAVAADHIFGFLLVNDWSARSIQAWEYRPLGPFLGKAFATSIAAWITPLEALEPFRASGPVQDPEPLPHLRSEEWALDLELEVDLAPADGDAAETISRTNARRLYWTAAQQLAHVTHGGATVRAGDLFASGTISGPDPGTHGCLLELTRAGEEPLRLGGGVERTFLEDGDVVILRGSGAPGEGRPQIALAEVSGRIEPARPAS
jgi:fumarylacetoacetase